MANHGGKNTVEVKAKIVPNQFISYRYAVNMVGGKPDVPELSKENNLEMGEKTSADLTRRESTKKRVNIIEKEEGYRDNLKVG
jgi:hypothetical protein